MKTKGRSQNQGLEERLTSRIAEKQCPFIETSFEDCFVSNLNSQNIDQAIYYCGGNFVECERYKRETGKRTSALPWTDRGLLG